MQVHSQITDSSPQNATANYAAMLHGQNDLRFEPAPQLGKLESGKVRVQVKAVGICGSDVQLLKRVCALSSSQLCVLAVKCKMLMYCRAGWHSGLWNSLLLYRTKQQGMFLLLAIEFEPLLHRSPTKTFHAIHTWIDNLQSTSNFSAHTECGHNMHMGMQGGSGSW